MNRSSPTNESPTIERQCAEANHRIVNNLASLSSLVSLQIGVLASEGRSKMFTAEEVCAMLRDIRARIAVVAKLHKSLAKTSDVDGVALGDFLRDVCSTIATASAKSATSIAVDCNCARTMEPKMALPIGFVVAELVTNSIKYAHPAGLPVKMTVACTTDASGTFQLDVADDGVGFPENFDPMTDGDLGLKLVRALAGGINATVAFDHSSLGVRCRLIHKLIQ